MNPSNKALAATFAVSLAGLAFITQMEGTARDAYLDAVGVPTICVGSTRKVFLGQTASLRECEERLQEDTTYAGKGVARLVRVRLTQEQYDALVSFVFNVGAGAFSKSTLLRKLNDGDCLGAAQEFPRWVYAKKKRLRGLVRRRALEAEMFRGGCDAG